MENDRAFKVIRLCSGIFFLNLFLPKSDAMNRGLLIHLQVLLMLACTFQSCNRTGKDEYADLAARIIPLSGNNKQEIYKIINLYKHEKNDLKYKAALFVLENMSGQYHHSGNNIARYRALFDTLNDMARKGTARFNSSWDSIQAGFDFSGDGNLVVINDLQVIKAADFTRQLEASFRAWNYPWARSLTFGEFCRYLLPFKLASEEPDNWKEEIQKKYAWIADSLQGNRDAKKVCLLLNNDLKKTFYINARFQCNWDPNYSDLCQLHTGTCTHATQMAAYIMRAMGVPVVMDYVPFWASKNGSHAWNALIDHGRSIDFVGSETDPGMNKIEFTRTAWIRRKRAKIFRRTYEIQKNSLALTADSSVQIPETFKSAYFIDVTKEYVPVSDVSLTVAHLPDNQRFAYLCVFNDNEWRPVCWSSLNALGNATFRDMGRDILYLPMYYQDQEYIPAGDPFILTKKGDMEKILPDKDRKQTIVIYKKYPEDKTNDIAKGERYELFLWNNKWISQGEQLAAADSLIYKNVPSGALYWIRDLDKGRQERIFTYRDGQQVWW